ncbi:MAG: class I SAM-dependent RNA methyltransferase [Jatrophihabitantaceae bacterium]
MADPGPLAGTLVEVEVGDPAHGGFCIARHAGRVVFVRHALPGERVRALVTEDRGSFCRADAVEILTPSTDRVHAPCPHSGPGRCGGCDWQHVRADAQRELKASVVREQFRRLAHLDVSALLTRVEPLPLEEGGGLLGWRTRITYAVGPDGHAGLHRYRSHEVEPIDECPLGAPGIGDSSALVGTWDGFTGVEAVRGVGPAVTLLGHRPGPGRHARGRRPPDRTEVLDGPDRLRYQVRDREFEIAATGFWQVHPAAAQTFAATMLDDLRPAAGESGLDLYAGAGALTAALADAVGRTGRVVGVESSARAVADAAANLAGLPWARVRRGRVEPSLLAGLDLAPDVVVLDPPRAGAGRQTMAAVLALAPRAVSYVACDPASLARDVATAQQQGWRLTSLRAFDAFPMTHHVECVALLEPAEHPGPEDLQTPRTT